HVLPDELRGAFLIVAADLADQDGELGLRVGLEALQRLDEPDAVDGVAADAHTGGLPDPARRQLVHDLVREGAAPRDEADGPRTRRPFRTRGCPPRPARPCPASRRPRPGCPRTGSAGCGTGPAPRSGPARPGGWTRRSGPPSGPPPLHLHRADAFASSAAFSA